MSTDASAQKLDELTTRISASEQRVGRLEGRQEQAQEELRRVETECTALGVEPDAVPAAIAEAEKAETEALQLLGQGVEALEASVKAAEQALEGGEQGDGAGGEAAPTE